MANRTCLDFIDPVLLARARLDHLYEQKSAVDEYKQNAKWQRIDDQISAAEWGLSDVPAATAAGIVAKLEILLEDFPEPKPGEPRSQERPLLLSIIADVQRLCRA